MSRKKAAYEHHLEKPERLKALRIKVDVPLTLQRMGMYVPVKRTRKR